MAEPSGPAISVKLSLKCRSLEAILDETFLSVASLRDALQMGACAMPDECAARTPAAQEKVICRELKKLSELNHRYKWQGDGSTELSQTGTPLVFSNRWTSGSEGSQHRTGESERSLKLELQKRDVEIQNLNATIERLVAKKEKLERRVRKLEDRKRYGHGSGIPTLSNNWNLVSGEDHSMMAEVVDVEEKAASVSNPAGNGARVANEQVKVSLNSAKKGGKHSGTAPQVAGRQEGAKLLESPRKEVRHHAAESGTIATVKLSNGVSGKHRRRGVDADATMRKQASSELWRALNGTVTEVSETVTKFCKAMVVHMKRAKWEIEEGGVEWVMESHKALAVQSYVCMRMFRGFEHEDFYMSGRLSLLLDPAKYREECKQQFDAMVQMVEEPLDLLAGIAPDSAFGQFCRKKFLQIFPERMEEALLGDLRHRHCLLRESLHPHWSRFYQAFVRMAKAVWMLHKLAFSLEPRISVFQAEKGADYSASFMESHIPNLELAADTHNLLPKVAFTVMPGLRRGEQVLLRCRVYLNGMKMSSPTR